MAPEDIAAMEAIPIEHWALLTLPGGWDIGQIKAEHPNTTFPMFVNMVLREIGRCILMPFNKVAGDSSNYNFASGKLDGWDYNNAIRIERDDCEVRIIDHIFAAWMQEATLIDDFLHADLHVVEELNHGWFWDPLTPVLNSQQEATANETKLRSGQTNFPQLYAEQGQDWESQQGQAARSLGLTVKEYQKLLTNKLFGGSSATTAEPEETDDEEVDDEDQETESEEKETEEAAA